MSPFALNSVISKTLVTTVFLAPTLSGGCYSVSGHSTIAKTNELCRADYAFTIFNKVPVAQNKALIFTEYTEMNSVKESNDVVRVYFKLTYSDVLGSRDKKLWIAKTHYELYGPDKQTMVATASGYVSKSPPEFGSDTVMTSCGINTPEFFRALVSR